MLNFYFITDEQTSNYSFTQAKYAGGITMHEFKQAQYAHIIEYHLDFFKDFRWSSTQVNQKLILVQNTNSEQFTALRKILQRAIEMNCGVIAFGD